MQVQQARVRATTGPRTLRKSQALEDQLRNKNMSEIGWHNLHQLKHVFGPLHLSLLWNGLKNVDRLRTCD